MRTGFATGFESRFGTTGRGLVRACVALALLGAAATTARADLPRVIAQGAAGPFEVSVLAEVPIRPGLSTWTVWVADAGTGEPVQVEIAQNGMRASSAAPGPVPVHVHRVGRSTATLEVRSGGNSGSLRFEFDVAPRPGLADYWRALSIAPLGLLLLGLHQWRTARQRRHGVQTRQPANAKR